MGQEAIIKEIVNRGEVLQKDLHSMFGKQGPFTRQLRKLREKRLAFRMKVSRPPEPRQIWMYFPTSEAIELYKKEVSK